MSYSEIHQDKSLNESLKICVGSGGESPFKCTDGSLGFAQIDAGDSEVSDGVCMPSPCALGCSFDRKLLYKVGRAVGSMAADEGFNALISPDVGVVRSPLYGGLSDRFGEDPYLCGALGVEWVKGAQSAGVAAVLSNFAGGTQSNGKFTCDNVIDRRALNEIYLRPFEMTIKMAKPRAVYCGLNKINGLYNGENPVLLTEILRRKWKFEGAVLADMRLLDPYEAMASGVDMSYPRGDAYIRRQIKNAVERGDFPLHYPEKCADRVRELTGFLNEDGDETLLRDECRAISREAAERSAVLLKNHRHTLPLPLSSSIALIGRQAKFPRIQRGGVNALRIDGVENMLNVFDENQIRYKYCEGFDEHSKTNETLLSEAVKCASKSEFAVVFVGFDDDYDNNSEDRFTNRLPKAQTKLINAVARANPNTVVVVNGSALPKMNWIGRVQSVLYMPLGGSEVCAALFNLLFGYSNPCGRLSVSYSLNEADMPCGDTFGRYQSVSEHRESIYVGYRYFNKANIYAAFPFGYGLSYTEFQYSKMRASRCSDGWKITLEVKNVGKRDGAEVVQIYVEAPKTDKFRPVRELKQFDKVYLAKGEKRIVTIILSDDAFSRYNPETGDFVTVSGRYRVCAAASSSDIRTEAWISLSGQSAPAYDIPNWYIRPAGRPNESDFRQLFGEDLNYLSLHNAEKYSVSCTLSQLSTIGIFKFAVKCIREIADWIIKPPSRRVPEYAERLDFILNMPVDRLCGVCRGFYPMRLTRLAIKIANRRGGKL